MISKSPPGDNIGSLPALEKWLYFLQQADQMEATELAEQLGGAPFIEAIGVLEMISRSPEDRQFYEARQKFLHDEQARLLAARQEGREEGLEEGLEEGREQGREQGREEGERFGLEKGEVIGKIRMLQELLGDSPTATNQLAPLGLTTLTTRLTELQQRLRDRQS